MTGWMFAALFFCLASMGWWTAERYRQMAANYAEAARQFQVVAETATAALVNSELSKRLVDNYTREMQRHERAFGIKAEVRH